MAKLKILAAADIHGSRLLVEKLAEKAEKENVDLVVLAGDITHMESHTEGLIGPFIGKNKQVLFIPGNHDTLATAEFWREFYGATNLHGYAIKVGDVAFFGCGGATKVGPHLTLEENEIFYLLSKAHEKVKDAKIKIMVTHVNPSGAAGDKLVPGSGSEAVKKAIEKFKPDILICGHIHEASGIEEKIGNTTVINVARSHKILEL